MLLAILRIHPQTVSIPLPSPTDSTHLLWDLKPQLKQVSSTLQCLFLT